MIVCMGLNAWVFCDCYEMGKVKTPPPQPELVYVDTITGEVSLRWEEEGADQHSFYEWRSAACAHGPIGCLVSHRLGNISSIGFLRELFQETPERFPTLLSKVVYNGSHGGDELMLADVEAVAVEMPAVHELHCSDESYEAYLREFESQMLDLIQSFPGASPQAVMERAFAPWTWWRKSRFPAGITKRKAKARARAKATVRAKAGPSLCF